MSSGNCTTRVVPSANSGFNDGSSCINPINVSMDATNIYLHLTACCAWGYWVYGTGWVYAGDADANCNTAYYRIFAWR